MEIIRERAEDAKPLWNAGRHEGAFLVALVAVAARARREYPRLSGDREVFERFVESRFRPRVSVEFRGELRSLERISTSGCVANSCMMAVCP
jgi:hypothetical protein